MSRQQQQADDPLADLRQEPQAQVTTQQPAGAPSAPPAAPADPDAPTGLEAAKHGPGLGILTDTAWHQAAATVIVDRWHSDMVARAQMHGGGTCGCRYAANLALVTLVGPPVPTPEPEAEDPDADGAS